jgi:hypothetical protein
MAKLSDTQLIVLSKAAARDDGLATIPEGLNRAAAAKVAASLVSRKLMREIRSKADMPVWREDEEGRGTSLVITRAGRDALGIEDGENDSSGEAATPKNEPPSENQQPSGRENSTVVDEPRSGSKQSRIIDAVEEVRSDFAGAGRRHGVAASHDTRGADGSS